MTTSTTPVPAGVVAVALVALASETLVAGLPPNEMVAPARKPVPVSVTTVPPAGSPVSGSTAVSVGGPTYMKRPITVTVWPSVFVTVIDTGPAAPAGLVTTRVVLLGTITSVAAAVPNITVAPVKNDVPVIVTRVPPATGPIAGVTAVMTGGGMNVNAFGSVPLCPSGFVTMTGAPLNSPGGVVAVSWVALTNVTFVASTPSTRTVAPLMKSVPVMVMAVPPDDGPLVGDTAVTAGAGT